MSRIPTSTTPDGFGYRDLNGNGVLDPYEDTRLGPEERTEDLLGRLGLDEKIGLLFHTVIESGPGGTVLEGPGAISKSGTPHVVVGSRVNHFNVHALGSAREAARWQNAVQELAETTPHGIPVTISTDPRHGFSENAGASFAAGYFSQWPEPLGIAALGDLEVLRGYAEAVRSEYVAVGIRAALHPTLDLASEPRWARQMHTFGADPQLVTEFGVEFLRGLQGERLGPASVAGTAKHFPGGGPQADGEDAHFPYGREQVYPGGRFAEHLAPFRAAVAAGTAAIMPYYGMPVGLDLDGETVPEVGFGFNERIVTGLLREELGYDGVVLTDWELVNDNHVGDQVLPARAWGVEHLDPAGRMELLLAAGCDQFGGEECVEVLAGLVRSGRVSEERIDASARRLLLVKMRLGLFDDPFVDEDAAERTVGRAEVVAAGLDAQAASVTVLADEGGLLPLSGADRRVYVEGMSREAAEALGTVVDRPEDADLAVVRLAAPHEPRSDLFLEAWFHQGSLDFPPGLPVRLARLREHCPLVVDVTLDRPAVLGPVLDAADVVVASFGSGGPALARALQGEARGRLPFDLPRSMADVRAHHPDQPGFDDPLLPRGHGIPLGVGAGRS
ncbi:Beta-hexosaminidase [Serinicoccus hydrothermalis]|uniref:beta-glucosidase n=1 Tax=Serinicoccus hydrothermalis TaxID=1758689 RepID=A0A1B1NCP4_9MICO|nr:glycoside hydrolase family 3 N-terminal domain-containing protein [Serinicoccus hydrothermalis]ANS79161.1 Beta-hexosaminidase [Serinicoccus hydrothermalis]